MPRIGDYGKNARYGRGNRNIKKSNSHLCAGTQDIYRFIKLYKMDFRVSKMAMVLGVSARGYYAWLNRGESQRELANRELSTKIEKIFDDSKGVYGSRTIKREIQRECGERVGLNRVLRLMKQRGLWSKVRKKYKATTNSNHGLPVADNILNRETFTQKDIIKSSSVT